MLIASLSLVAFPFMAGFYSKDLILESAFGQYQYSSIAVYFTATIGAVFTTLYSAKVLYLTFFTNPNGPVYNYKNAHEGDIFMSLPLMVLAIFSIFFGYMTKDLFIGLASGFFLDNSLFIHPLHEIMLNTEFAVPLLFKLLPLMFTVSFSLVTLIMSELLPVCLIYFKHTRLGYNLFSFFNLRFLVEILYNRFITLFIFRLGGQTTKVLDKGSVELFGPHGLETGLLKVSKSLSGLDTGVITSYALYIVIALILYMLIPYIRDDSVVMLLMYGLYTTSRYEITNSWIYGKLNEVYEPPILKQEALAQNSSVHVYNIVKSSIVPPEIWEMILNSAGAGNTDTKEQIDVVLLGLDKLENNYEHLIAITSTIEQDVMDRNIAFRDLQSEVSRDLTELIHKKNMRLGILSNNFSDMETYMHDKTYVGKQNIPDGGVISHRINYTANDSKYNNIREAINQLDSYKRWTASCDKTKVSPGVLQCFSHLDSVRA